MCYLTPYDVEFDADQGGSTDARAGTEVATPNENSSRDVPNGESAEEALAAVASAKVAPASITIRYPRECSSIPAPELSDSEEEKEETGREGGGDDEVMQGGSEVDDHHVDEVSCSSRLDHNEG